MDAGLKLFFEKIIKRAARIDMPRAAASGIASLAFNGSPAYEVLAMIANIFFGDALENRLCALKSRAGVEMTAVLARPQIGLAFGAFALERYFQRRRDQRPAEGAAQYFLKTRHLHVPGTVSRSFRRLILRRLLRAFAVTTGILVSALPVFSLGHAPSQL